MADHQAEEGDVYVYTGGQAPDHITHAIIDKSVNEIDDDAFSLNSNLRSVKTHNALERIGQSAFEGCESLTDIDLRSVKILGFAAFKQSGLTEADCDKLEIVGTMAFQQCEYLRRISLPRAKVIRSWAFYENYALTEVELPEVDQIEGCAFSDAIYLRRVAIPLKADLFVDADDDNYDIKAFYGCHSLTQVDLVGGINETVSSLHFESWRNDMNEEIAQINKVLESTRAYEKTAAMIPLMESVFNKVKHYKDEHNRILMEAATILELALWKVNLLDDEAEEICLETKAKKVKIDVESARKMAHVTCGADIIIKNILPFLQLE